MTGNRPLIAIAANSGWNILNYRLGLVRAIAAAGFDVTLLVPPDDHAEHLEAEGATVQGLPMQPRGTSPLADLLLLLRYWRALRRIRPAAFLGFTIKPNIYGSLAAAAAGVPVINNISGLGTLFVRRTALTRLVVRLYKAALARSATVFFQNRDDSELFLAEGLVRKDQLALLPGSGVDLDRFTPAPEKPGSDPAFLLAARLLWDKGIAEFIQAARLVRKTYPEARFQVLGFIEPESPAAVPAEKLEEWRREGVIDYLGGAADVRPHIAGATCVVLPSYYREGVPRILLEAAAMARPLITTDTPGCRDAVEDGQTGLLCQPRSAESLASAIGRIIAMPKADRERMGAAGRSKMEREFDQGIVHAAYLDALRRAGISPGGAGGRKPDRPMNLFKSVSSAFGGQAPASGPAGYRVYAVGDVHGRLDLLERMLAAIERDIDEREPTDVVLLFLGDLIDRGPSSAEVVERLRTYRRDRVRTVFLIGNHEEVLLRIIGGERGLLAGWLKFGGAECARSYGLDPRRLRRSETAAIEAVKAAVPATHVEFLKSFADTFRFGDYLFVHAGIRPGIDVTLQDQADLRWIREPFLNDDTDHGFIVVHGHTISDEVDERPNRIGIDTGAYRSGVLTALVVDGSERRFLTATMAQTRGETALVG